MMVRAALVALVLVTAGDAHGKPEPCTPLVVTFHAGRRALCCTGGACESRYPGGAVEWRIEWDGKQLAGAATLKRPDGSLAAEGRFVAGREDGPWRDVHPGGKTAAQGTFRAGAREGTWTTSYPDGTPREIETFAGGDYHGPYQSFHPGGAPWCVGKYDQGEKAAKWTCRRPDGVISAEGGFVRGDPRGKWTLREGAKVIKVTDPTFIPDVGPAY